MAIGLFGTCGGSKWRDRFIAAYEAMNIPYFNPYVPDWNPELAKVEAWHLANDSLILFPVTSETYAVGSLAEIGFSILSTINTNSHRFVIVFIDPNLDEALLESKGEAKNSKNARQLVLAHLKEQNNPNVFLVESLDDMLKLSVILFSTLTIINSVKTDTWKSQMDPTFWHEVIHRTMVAEEEELAKELVTA